jgi:outer membrane protein OmpU
MNKLNKIGLSALAGSLMAMSANAADVSLSGGASVGIFQDNEDQPSGYFMNDNVNLTISGETDSGLTVTTKLELDAGYTSTAPFDNRSISIASDGMGTLTFHGHGGDSVMSGWDDKVPTAYEEPWALVDSDQTTTTTANTEVSLINGVSGDALWRYDSPDFNGASIHASYRQGVNAEGQSSGANISAYNDFGIQISPEMVEGLSIGYAMGTVQEAATIENDESTLWVTYASGPFTVGYQTSEVDGQTTTQDDDSTGWGVSYAITDDFSVSYGQHEFDNGATTNDQEATGFSVSYTSGGVTIAGAMNSVDNLGGSTEDQEGYELSVAFAF